MSAIRPLAEGYPTPDLAQWRALCDKALNGADFDRALVKRTSDGLIRGPLKTAQDVTFTSPEASARDEYLPWHIRQAIVEADPKAANEAALTDLNGGVSALELILDPTGQAGVAVRQRADLDSVLEGVALDLAPVHLRAREQSLAYGALFMDYISDLAQPAETLGHLGLCPFDEIALSGSLRGDHDDNLKRAVHMAHELSRLAPQMSALRVGADLVFEAGGSEAQELAYSAAAGTAYLAALIDAGLSPDVAARQIEFSFAADSDVHLTIAKLRAARRIWAKIAASFGAAGAGLVQRQHASTAARMMSVRDPWSNLIRVAAAGFGAAVGGVDGLTLRPLSDAIGAPNRFARRVSRNMQVMLMEESHLGRVADPAAGSFYHDSLSEDLAQTAWALFQAIETEGGILAALKSQSLHTAIAAVRDAKAKDYATGKETLIGINQYPDLEERALSDLSLPHEMPARAGDVITAQSPVPAQFAALSPMRFAAPFEALRDVSDTAPETPKAFLATLGSLAAFNARTSFTTNRLAVAGIIAEPAKAYSDIAACAAAFQASGTRFAVICGTDSAYDGEGAALAHALKTAGADLIWIAGRAGDNEAELRAAGVSHFVHLRSDALTELTAALTTLGLMPGEAA
ncbi:methylmalonyl-CoA mutase family protein [Woodsholea maritima]|uniref:methylmalonyl-CoA mutase family protein n=1 Tax=Woodsholea maritima TaxID=240237 RepID=UPI00036457CD|nr:methylmalonyl-CoA mutase family protein [Woodsholea maritima]